MSEPPSGPSSRRLAEIRQRLAASSEAPQAARQCHNAQAQHAARPVQAVGPVQPVVNDLLYRNTDEVRGWLLLERQVAGCSIPISWPHSRGAVVEPRRSSPSGD